MSDKKDLDQKLIGYIKQSRLGDKKSYNSLLQEAAKIIEKFIYSKVGNKADNDDILQEVLIAIHKSLHTYNSDRSFLNWMFAIANFKVKDYLRSYYKNKRFSEVDFHEIEFKLSSDVTFDGHNSELLNEILLKLPEKQRKILYLSKIEGYDAKEVAQIMNMSVSAVKVASHRAIKKLIAEYN